MKVNVQIWIGMCAEAHMRVSMKQILHVAAVLIMVLCYSGYLLASLQFCKGYLFVSKKKERLFFIFSLAVWLLLNFAAAYVPIPYFILILLGRLSFAGAVLCFFSGAYGEKILAASLLMAAMTLVQTFCESLFWCLLLLITHMAGISYPVWAGDLTACASLGIAAWAVYCFSNRRMTLFACRGTKWCAALAIPLIVTVIVFDMAKLGAANGILLRSGGNLGTVYDQMFSHLGFCVLALLAMFAVGAYVIGADRIFLEQEKGSRYRSQIAVYQMLEEQYSRSERMRHDMKNHIIAMSGLFRSKEWEKLGNYLKNMEAGCLENSADITGNKAVDALLYQKRRQAEQRSIAWECNVQIPKSCGIHEFDFCVLFGNLLDNALEACERMLRVKTHGAADCFINIQAKTVKKCFLLIVKNSVDEAEQQNTGIARKKNPQGHGIGLLNVGDVVHRYQGVLHTESEGGIFVISVLIPLDAAAHNMERIV